MIAMPLPLEHGDGTGVEGAGARFEFHCIAATRMVRGGNIE
jgi:hypothetical protein